MWAKFGFALVFLMVWAAADDCESRCIHDLVWSLVEFTSEPTAETWLTSDNVEYCFSKCIVPGNKESRSWTPEAKARFYTVRTQCLPGGLPGWAKGLDREDKCRTLDGVMSCESKKMRAVMSGFLGQPCSAIRAVRALGQKKASIWDSMPHTCSRMFNDTGLCA